MFSKASIDSITLNIWYHLLDWPTEVKLDQIAIPMKSIKIKDTVAIKLATIFSKA